MTHSGYRTDFLSLLTKERPYGVASLDYEAVGGAVLCRVDDPVHGDGVAIVFWLSPVVVRNGVGKSDLPVRPYEFRAFLLLYCRPFICFEVKGLLLHHHRYGEQQ